MAEQKPIISIDHVSMRFNLSKEKHESLKEYFVALLHGGVRFDEFFALDDVSFDIMPGDFYGLIGLNGSGKSTLLKVISGVYKPSAGKVTVNGTIAPLIELGAGFDMDLTARENIYLNGTVLGYTPKYIDSKFDDIVEFSELQDFLDVPLKNYSSGMVARLAFAVATITKPDILIADEPTTALDVTIQAQILDLMRDLQKKMGMAIIMITHDLGVVAQMCDEVIVMYAGSICEQGTADEIFYNPRHEYTKGLMRSIPTAENNGQRLEPITGTPIDLLNMPKGCPFAPRCEAAMKICLKEKPVRMLINDDHMATCWMNVKKGVEDGSITEEGGVPCV